MTSQEISKHDAAQKLLDRAIQCFLDEADYCSSIVLAGAAEEVFGRPFDPIDLKDRPTVGMSAIARFQRDYRVLSRALDPHAEPVSDKSVAARAVRFYNWMKHNSPGQDDAQTVCLDLEGEAADIIDRACANMHLAMNRLPLRALEFESELRRRRAERTAQARRGLED